MPFRRLKIGTRIYFGFGVSVVLALGVLGFGLLQFWSVRDHNRAEAVLAASMQRVLEASRELETVRRAETHYRLDADDASLKERESALGHVKALLKACLASTGDPAQRRVFEQLLPALDDHDASFAKLVRATDTITDANRKLDEGGRGVAIATAKLLKIARTAQDPAVIEAAGEIDRLLILARVTNWRFQALYDPKGPAAFTKDQAKAEAAIAALAAHATPEIRHAADELAAEFTVYASAFRSMADATLAAIALDEQDLVPQIVAMQKRLAAAKAELVASFDASSSENGRVVGRATLLQEALAPFILALGAGLAALLGRSIARPITRMTDSMRQLAGGDTSTEIPAREREDEIGAMAGAVSVFRDNMIRAIALSAEQEAAHAARETRAARIAELLRGFEAEVSGTVEHFHASSTALETTAQTMSEIAGQANQQAASALAAADEANAGAQTVATASEQLACSIEEIGRQVAQSTEMTGRSVAQTERTDALVRNLTERAGRIEQVLALINGIAAQTNLLALNATIESARAGEAGKGFAVVAAEVKGLANRTALATDEIAEQIHQVQAATQEAVEAIEVIATLAGQVRAIATSIASAVEEQGAATAEIARNVQQTARGTGQVTANMGRVNEAASGTGAAAEQVLGSATSMSREAERLSQQVKAFVAGVRAA